MAVRKTRNFLPTVFQTDTNEKFLSATMDQLISEPVLTNLYGYVGRKFAPTYKDGDSYITEGSADRQHYQLEPSTVVRDDLNNITFFSNYIDYLNKLKYYGAVANNQSRMFTNDYYSFDPLISLDKFVNFSQYYWLPDGPTAVEVNTTGVELQKTYNVTRDTATGTYTYTSDGIVDNSITLARGGTYKFVVDQAGYPFWIQSELGTSGAVSATPTLSSRDVMGVVNNGIDSGTITFNVPVASAQERFVLMPTVAVVDYATPLAYSDYQNSTVTQFLEKFPQYAGIVGQFSGKTLVFVDFDKHANGGDALWTAPTAHDNDGNALPDQGAGDIVPESLRFGVWQVQFEDVGIGDYLIKLVNIQDVSVDQKVYIKYGVANANKEYYKDYDGFFYQMPLLSSLLDHIYAQDEVNATLNTEFKIVDFNLWSINVDTDIVGKANYTSPNNVEFTSGLKIRFDADVTPTTYQYKEFYVEGVGDLTHGIQLVPVTELVTPELYNDENALNYPDTVFPEYITINRSSMDRNPWSRNNRWFHRDVIAKTAKYNNTLPIYNQTQRAQRPIVQFESNLQLMNNGRIGKLPIDILDVATVDAFNQYEGEVLTSAFGITLTDGLRIVFANDIDPLVKNKIYVINLVQYEVDNEGLPTGPKHIKLVKADDGDIETHDSVVVNGGQFKGAQWWFDGVTWIESQQKTQSQQEPLFDVFDSTFDFSTGAPATGKSFSQYNRSDFEGTKIFGYLQSSAGVPDPVLGFPLSYRNFTTQGDIEFQTYFSIDTFNYTDDQGAVVTKNVSTGFLQKIKDRYTVSPKNTWQVVVEPTKQYQSIGYIYDGTSNIFPIDVTPNVQASVPYVKVFKNFMYLTPDQWVLVSNQIRLTVSETFVGDDVTKEFRLTVVTSTANGVIVLINGIPRRAENYYTVSGTTITFNNAPSLGDVIDIRVIQNPAVGDKIDILVYSDEVSKLGFYQVPSNLDLNAQNLDISVLTLGQLRNHLVALGQNSTTVTGNILGISNLRDVDIKQQGGTILQHSAPVPYGELFLLDKQANFIDGVRYAQREYTKFKNKFLELSVTMSTLDPNDPAASVDLIITEINKVKNVSFPWYHSDMVPYNTLKTVNNYTVFDTLKTDYELTRIFSSTTLSNQAVIIYLNDQQLPLGAGYEFRTDRPAVTMLVPLAVNDVIKIVEYDTTDGCYVPETPTKLGLWPRWIPEAFEDDTYRQPITVIRGHDGSTTPAFGDYRDAFLLELEMRIYNNIKLPDLGSYADIFSVIPGKFRTTPYTLGEITQLISKSFQGWAGNNKIDFSTNDSFESNDAFTWNYATIKDRVDGSVLQGSWRACYQYFYDTIRPHLTPWEMLGFTTKPNWWEEFYGPGPYTKGNALLWDDLEAGYIRYGVRAGIDPNYARPGLSAIIPVDENGNLLPPSVVLTASYSANRAASAWAVGQYGPAETAWRNSSDFPYAVQQAIALAIPAKYFSISIDTYGNSPYNATFDTSTQTGQYLNPITKRHINQLDIYHNGEVLADSSIYRGAGYLNWIADYLISQGVNATNKLQGLIKNYQVNLAYKVAGFTDQSYLNVLAEQVSPSSTNDTIVIPNENYKVHLNKSAPVKKLIYSAVIIEKNTNGYSVRGYDLNNPYFTIIPSTIDGNSTKITVLDSSATIYKNYQNLKLTVPYGYEFTSQQQIVDFLISYERFLKAQGFTFNDRDDSLGEMRNWTLSAKEFLYWAQQGWQPGSIVVLSPVSNSISAISLNAIADGISDTQYSSRVIDQNFKLIKNVEYEVMRSPTNFTVSITNPNSVLGFVEVDLVQYEHVLVFDNVTVFNDIIYKPESGNRQFRLKLVGQKTANWDGSLYAPGFIYSTGLVDEWQPGKDYLQGDIVQYKNQYYTALQNIIANASFQFGLWEQVKSSDIQAGLFPNFSTIGAEAKAYYDSYPSIDNKKQIEYSHGLIGYRPRQYLSDLGLSTTTQIEFYKGFIKQKGSLNSVNQLIKAEFNNLTSNISLYEEWALRLGTYGAEDINPYVEIALDEKKFGVNPSMAQFVGPAENNQGDGVSIFNQSQLYKLSGHYDGNIALNRTENSNYDNDILTAGYVNIDDVDATIFDLSNYIELDNELAQIGTGYTIWCAKDFTQDWNVYRVTETNNHLTTVTNVLNGYVEFEFDKSHLLSIGDIFLVRGFDPAFDSFYQVHSITSDVKVIVQYSGDLTNITSQSGFGMFFILNSMRFVYMEDSRIYGHPTNGWKVGDKIWIDVDAETTAVQGQPHSPTNTWKVYEKQHPWEFKQRLVKQDSASTGFGSSIKMSADGFVVVSGSPNTGNGIVASYLKNYRDEYVESYPISSTADNVYGFGSIVDLAVTTDNTSKLAVGAPTSNSNIGYVSVYSRPIDSQSYAVSQILPGAASDQFGTSLAFNQDGSWLYVGAPGNNKVYTYGLNKFVPYQKQIKSINNHNEINLANVLGAGTLIANVGDVITQPITGANMRVTVGNWPVGSNKIIVDNITNLLPKPGEYNNLGNITVDGAFSAPAGSYISQSTSGANLQLVTTIAGDIDFYGLYVNTNRFDKTGVIAINGVTSTIKPTRVESGNLLINGTETRLYANLTSSTATTNNIILSFAPAVNDANSLLITSSVRTYVPGVEYTLDFANANVIFSSTLVAGDYAITQQPYYSAMGTLTGDANSKFGYAVSSSFDGAQLAIGAPDANVMVSGSWVQRAGTVWVYDRVIEAFNSTGGNDYTTKNTIQSVHRVVIDNVEVTDYFVVGTNTIRFITPPAYGKVVFIETNRFNLLEKLIGIDSLEGGLSAIQANAAFGTSLTICSNNCAIYIGAPYYDAGTSFNTGAVWKFHNRGRLYGTNNGYTANPVFTPGDTFRLDNFEISVSGRMMPTTLSTGASANILALSSNVTATAGQVISQDQGAGHYANVTVLANTSTGGSQFITVSNYTTAYQFNYGPGNVVRVGSTVSTAYPMASLDSLIKDINDANLLGIYAVNENNHLRLRSDSTVAKNLLRILSGSNSTNSGVTSPGVYASADMIIFAFMQIIINPYDAAGEYFGSKVKLASNAYMLVIGSARGTTRHFTTFDVYSQPLSGTVYVMDPDSAMNTVVTTFDSGSTRLFDHVQSSGSVYIYELYDDPRDAVEHPGRYAFAQQLDTRELAAGDQFGYSVDIEGSLITVSAPGDDENGADAGAVYIFENPNRTRGWKLIRWQQDTVDIDSVSRIYLYNSLSNTILENLQFIDPAKGRILGQAEQEISYKTEYDPAMYNRGTDSNTDINPNIYWNDTQVGKVWWNLSTVRFVNYEQDTLTYRSINWGKLFPGSTVEICEWVESTVLPGQYVVNGGDGVPKYADDSAYVEITFVDPTTNIIGSKYYYWVKNKTSVDSINEQRSIPTSTIAELITNPKNQGITYAAIIKNNAIILYNASSLLSAKNTILHIDYQLSMNTNIIHSEYELVKKDDPLNIIPTKVVNKLVDSLAGIDQVGRVVPDPKLSLADRYGIDVRPRQGLFVDRLAAMDQLISYVNAVLVKKPIARQYDLSLMLSEDAIPNINLGEYDQIIATDVELGYLDINALPTGYKVLVEADTAQDNLWVIYQLDANNNWQINRVQGWKTSLYWDYVDWYDQGYAPTDQIQYYVETLVDALKLTPPVGSEIMVKVTQGAGGGWNILVVQPDHSYRVVAIEKGTIQLKTSLSNFADNEIGFGNQGFAVNRYDQNPNYEIRNVVQALKDDIFVRELQGEFNKAFFVLINYLFNEQKYVDWIFKTSFVSVAHQLRTLSQFPSYIRDNQTYYQDYINEVKPYRTKLREYLINYSGNDTYPSTVTDFDLPPYYDANVQIFRSPTGDLTTDEAKWQTYPYNQWYNNRALSVTRIILENPGLGYSSAPTVTIIDGSSGGTGATAVAYIDGNTGSVTHIEVTNSGSNYSSSPLVFVNGTCAIPATAYAEIKNAQVRSFDTTLKFDRINYTSSVKEWTPGMTVTTGDIITYAKVDGDKTIRQAYLVTANAVTSNTFISTEYTVVSANIFTNANDRIMAYYQPSATMPARDLAQLVPGVDYPGVQVQGAVFRDSPFFGDLFDFSVYDNIDYDEDGVPTLSNDQIDTIIRSNYTDAALGTRAEDIDVDGGAYVDRYSSHAPEELIPGVTFDTLDMKVYTKINSNTSVIGFRIFNNMLNQHSYLRLADHYSTTLAANLSLTDTQIFVSNSSALLHPDAALHYNPGVVFIGAERITYWKNTIYRPVPWGPYIDFPVGTAVSYSGNNYVTTGNVYADAFNYGNVSYLPSNFVLEQIRRGTQGTATSVNTYPVGTSVVDGSVTQTIPGIFEGNVTLSANTSYTVTSQVAYTLTLSGNITANVGYYITQGTSGANATVLAKDDVLGNVYTVSYNSALRFDLLTTTVNPLANIAINGAYTGNIYPIGSNIAGYGVNSVGNVTIPVTTSNVVLQTGNIWGNIGVGVASDGTGFTGANTAPVLFLKAYTVTSP